MKRRLLVACLAALVFLAAPALIAQEQKDPEAQLKELVDKIRAKLQQGGRTEAALAEEIKGFDQILADHRGEKTDAVAQVLYMKATLYTEVFENQEKGVQLLEQLKNEFPESGPGKNADRMIAALRKQAELAVGKSFPDFNEKDLDGKPLSLAAYKGKVVLVDFWATWCGPCIGELPNVLAAYEKHHPNGFEIIGVSLDQDRDKLTAFLKEKKMTWPQFFDGQGWQNKLAQDYGINSIPATFLVDAQGRIVARDLRGPDLEAAVAKALGKN